MSNRRQNFQTISWFWDLHNKELLNLDPPYQRRSVWNQDYKDYFIDTILLGYPAPAIFLYQDVSPDGSTKYSVADGKQRLTTIFEFAKDAFTVYENAKKSELRGKVFSDFTDDTKIEFWQYSFSVEYLPTNDSSIVNDIFDRINRNVAKLTPQELRHAKYDGKFITAVESLSEWMLKKFPTSFPRIVESSRKQMKDVEMTSQLILFLEDKASKDYSQDDLDLAFSSRDSAWELQSQTEDEFKVVINKIAEIIESSGEESITKTRLRNQADFFALFGSFASLIYPKIQTGEENSIDGEQHIMLPSNDEIVNRLRTFVEIVDDQTKRQNSPAATKYYQTTRAAVNKAGVRNDRINILKDVILGNFVFTEPNDSSQPNLLEA
jgi:hypothetical protein